MPQPPPPSDEIALYARIIVGFIRRGTNGGTAAMLMNTRLGIEYAREGMNYTPDQVLEQFRQNPDAWKALEPYRDKFVVFWEQARETFRQLVEKHDAKHPATT